MTRAPAVPPHLEIIRRVGAGGMGEVYEARDHGTGERVAVKWLARASALDIYLFKNEFRALAGISHPNLVTLRALVEHEGHWLLTMDFVDGVTWASALRASPGAAPAPPDTPPTETVPVLEALPLEVAESAPTQASTPASCVVIERLRGWLVGLANGLCHLHNAGVVHRDIKPTNVMIDADDHVQVLDFGLAHVLSGNPGAPSLAGTVAYMSPEQRAGGLITAASDWYSVGAMLHEALTGLRLDHTTRERDPDPRALAPSLPEDLAALCAALLQPAPEDRPDACGVLSALGRPLPPPPRRRVTDRVVGRAAAFDRIERAATRAARGALGLILVEGRSGVGKSTFVEGALARLAGRFAILQGRCHAEERIPFKALDPIVDQLVAYHLGLDTTDQKALAPNDLAALAQLFPVVARLPIPAMGHAPADGLTARRQAAGALRAWLTRLATKRPVVIAIDDLQWGDSDSARLMQLVLEVPPPGVLMIATYRAEDANAPVLAGVIAWALGAGADRIAIEALDDDDADVLARELLLGAPDDVATRARWVRDQARGHPHFVKTLCRWVNRLGGVPEGAGLDDVLRAERRELPAVANALLEVLAVAGHPISVGLARALAGDAPYKALALLRAQGWIGTTGLAPDGAIRCAHDRVRREIVARLPEARRRSLHRALGEALSATDLPATEETRAFHHFVAAGAGDRALALGPRVAERATAALAFDEAARLYHQLVTLVGPEHPRRLAWLELEGESLARAGRAREAALRFLEVAAGAPERAAPLQLRAGEQLLHSGHFEAGLAALDPLLPKERPARHRSAPEELASLVWQRLRTRAAQIALGQRSRRNPPSRDTLAAYYVLSTSLSLVRPLRAFDYMSRYLRLARAGDDPEHLARAVMLEAAQLAGRAPRHWPRAAWLLASAEAKVREAGLEGPVAAHATGVRAVLAFQQGHWRSGVTAARACRRLLEGSRDVSPWLLNTAYAYEGMCLGYLGELGELAELGREVLGDALDRGDLYAEMYMRVAVPVPLRLIEGEPDRAEAETRAFLSRWSARGHHLPHLWALRTRALAALYRGEPQRAAALLDDETNSLAARMYLRLPVMGAVYLDLTGRVALALAQKEGSVAARRQAVACAKRLARHPLSWSKGLGLQIEAQVLALDGREREAAVGLAAASGELAKWELGLNARATAWRSAILRGDSKAEVEAIDWARAQGAREPARLLEVFAP